MLPAVSHTPLLARRAFLATGLAFIATGCDTPPERRQFAQLTYQHLPPIRLDVAEIVVVEAYESPKTPPYIDHLFPLRPSSVAARWAKDRLQAGGRDGQATYTVRVAEAKETPLERSSGLTGIFTEDQSDRYDLIMQVDLEVLRMQPVANGKISAQVQRSQTVGEDMTLNEREAVWYQMTESAMNELDGKLETIIKDRLARFVIG